MGQCLSSKNRKETIDAPQVRVVFTACSDHKLNEEEQNDQERETKPAVIVNQVKAEDSPITSYFEKALKENEQADQILIDECVSKASQLLQQRRLTNEFNILKKRKSSAKKMSDVSSQIKQLALDKLKEAASAKKKDRANSLPQSKRK